MAKTVSVLVVAGGGGAGNRYSGAGGGAGGLLYEASHAVTAQVYSVTVGAGGLGGKTDGAYVSGDNGENSVFDDMTAIGGGGGGAGGNAAGNGGSGGGSFNQDVTPGTGTAGPPRQGYDGGQGLTDYATYTNAGGGGGAGAVGQTAAAGYCGDGGVGVDYSSVFGTGVGESGYFAGGGGGGGTYSAGTGGTGGGGDGTTSGDGQAATANTGGGGGGSVGNNADGGNGGSGIVLIRYLATDLTATGGTITTEGSYKVHKFTANGNFEVTALLESQLAGKFLTTNSKFF